MKIEKNGGWCHLEEYGAWIYGDIYASSKGTIIVRRINTDGANIVYDEPSEVWATISRLGRDWRDGRMTTYVADAGKMHMRYDIVDGEVAVMYL